MEKTIAVINELKEKGIIKDYAIGGGIAAIYYVEPLLTYDLDIFFIPKEDKKGLLSLSPIYDFLKLKGFKPHKEQIIIEGIPVQFIPPYNKLTEEAIHNAKEAKYYKVKTRVFRPEYVIAIMLHTFRPKDKERLIKFIDEAKINKEYLNKILEKHGLKNKFNDFIKQYYEK